MVICAQVLNPRVYKYTPDKYKTILYIYCVNPFWNCECFNAILFHHKHVPFKCVRLKMDAKLISKETENKKRWTYWKPNPFKESEKLKECGFWMKCKGNRASTSGIGVALSLLNVKQWIFLFLTYRLAIASLSHTIYRMMRLPYDKRTHSNNIYIHAIGFSFVYDYDNTRRFSWKYFST